MSAGETTGRRSVVVCDEQGRALGLADVLEVHRGGGVLHKAFSILVFRRGGEEILLQRRSRHKALFPMRWANTCCSHPGPAVRLVSAAQQRLREEFGFSVPLREAGSFVYRARDEENDLTEFEHDTVLIGSAAETIALRPDPDEIAEWRWASVSELRRDLVDAAESYAPWLSDALDVALRRPQGLGK